MKRILIIPPFNPYPLISGGHQAIFNGIAILENEFEVYLIVPVTESQYKRQQHVAILKELPFVHVIPFILPNTKHTMTWYWQVLKNKYNGYMQKWHLHKSAPSVPGTETKSDCEFSINDWIGDVFEEEVRLVQKSIGKYHIDIVQCEMIPAIALCDYIPSSVKKIFVHHEVRFVRNELLLRQHPEVAQNLAELVRKDKEKEVRYLNRYDMVVTLSETDSLKLKQAGVQTHLFSSFAVVRDVPKLVPPIPSQKRLIFIGPEFHAPNIEGVMWFLDNCWGRIHSIDPSYQFDIIGKWSEETASALADKYPGVKCRGFVDDLHAVTQGATMIVPILVGSGIRMKILESAQWGVPIVTTSVGVEGLPLINEKHLLIADTPEAFVNAVISFEEMEKRQSCTDAILTDVLPLYSLGALKENRLKCYVQ